MPAASVVYRFGTTASAWRPKFASAALTADPHRLFVDERQRVAAAHGGAAVLERIPGKPDRRTEVVQILVVEPAVDETSPGRWDRAARREPAAVEHGQQRQVVVFPERTVVLPLQAGANA